MAKPRFIGPLKTIEDGNTEHLFKPFDYKMHDYILDLLPMPIAKDLAIYQKHIKIGRTAVTCPTTEDLDIYLEYVKQQPKDPSAKDLELYANYIKMSKQCC